MQLSSFAFTLAFLASAVLTAALVPCIRAVALRYGFIDVPARAPERKVHGASMPLFGGAAVFLSFFIVVSVAVWLGADLETSFIPQKYIVGIFLGSCVLMLGGLFDDRLHWKPSRQIIFPLIAALIVIASGIGITFITNPFGGQIRLDGWQQILLWFKGIPYRLTLPADLFTLVWLLGMMYTTKFLDGLDGLVSGVTIIGSLAIAALALDPVIHQNGTALLAVILAGAFFGFLPWNWHPAKIFLGEGGSLFAGFMLGVLAIISGSKVTTTVLVVGIPILDAAWVIVRRLFWERRSPFVGDRKHLHHRLLDLGFSHRSVVGMLYFFSAYFGITALFLQSRGKLIALVILSVTMLLLGIGLVYGYWRRKH